MDYEKAYKAVLQTATQWIKDGCTDKERICLECVFPELREGEDERIRKELIEAFEAYDIESSWNLIPVKHILAWLEKQKEQEPNIELIQRSWYMEGYHDREFGKEPKWIIKTGEGGPKHELNPRYGQPLVDEQKPAEWSEKDDQLIGFIFDLLNSLVWRKEWAMDKKECLERLKSIRPSWKPSEEQMSMLLAVINEPNNAGSESCHLALKSIYEHLKKLM